MQNRGFPVFVLTAFLYLFIPQHQLQIPQTESTAQIYKLSNINFITPREQTPPPPPTSAVYAGRYGQQAGGTHRTGIHSCLNFSSLAFFFFFTFTF